MRVILKEDYLKIPEGVEVQAKARKVTVTGPRGSNYKDFSHVALDIQILNMSTAKMSGKYVRIQMWNGAYRQACAVSTIKSHINNMIIGVTEGFRYKMRLVHAHFPITAIIPKDGKSIEIKNFLGGKKSHIIKLNEGCSVFSSKDVKDELVFDGRDIGLLSQTCARVCQVCKIGKKDERKFLDGIFVSQKTLTAPKDE